MTASPSSTAAAATNIMLAIFEKKTNPIELYRPLRNYIAFNYSEREAQNLEDDLQTLKQLRSDVKRHSDPSLPSRRDLLISYFKFLSLVETRFPISPDPAHVNALTFVWFDAFKPKQKSSQQNIHLEKAVVLFNLGAVYNPIGLFYCFLFWVLRYARRTRLDMKELSAFVRSEPLSGAYHWDDPSIDQESHRFCMSYERVYAKIRIY